ncbi:FmdB family transcriptional regulator [Halanaerobiaceae bacterium Z-7014]|uniref:FmdB family transcriptional regulator n=1 Tax=Halonatronomonas betaini TaxID=2778430 RepID=A0A931AWJ8_9FIRM|nr:FmdB family zinc ribbon protein [Halonatronomonas betaini]MBF8438105.1 FmdB family transcriptional regulator [Halonatronomonas betaini]
MPTYLYECEKCGRFEKLQGIKDEALKECPDCSGEVKRIIGAPGIRFKGSGFYCTDHKTDKSSKSSSDEKAS